MARYLDVHPVDPQPRLVSQAVKALQEGGVIAYPTDSGYALGCALGNAEGKERISTIRQLGNKHQFALMCSDFAQLGQLVCAHLLLQALKALLHPGIQQIVRAHPLPQLRQLVRKHAPPGAMLIKALVE